MRSVQERQPNHLLRTARLHTPSTWDPGGPMTQTELAVAVADIVEKTTGTRPGTDAKAIGRMERGAIRWPGRQVRAALRAITGAETDADLGFARPGGAPAPTVLAAGILGDVNRRDLLRGVALAGPSIAVSGVLDGAALAAAPHRAGMAEVRQVTEALRVFGSWDYQYGGGFVRDAAAGQLRWAAQLLEADCSDRVRHELGSVIARFADACAFMAFDDHDYRTAEGLFGFALTTAEHAGDRHVRAGVLADMALMAVWVGDPAAAVALTGSALADGDTLTATERAMLLAGQARAHGTTGDAQATWRAVGEADDAFAERCPADDPPRMSYYTEAMHASETGAALTSLTMSVAADPAPAVERQQAAAGGHSDDFARSRAHAVAQMAMLAMASGDPDEGAAWGVDAVEAAGRLQSKRSGDYLRALRRLSDRHAGRPAVDDMRERVTAALA